MSEKLLGWKDDSRAAMEGFLRALERDLPAGATVAEIERAMLEHHRLLLAEVMQALASREPLFPPGNHQP